MTWSCAAITNGVTFYSDKTIAPCCLIDHTYRKPLAELANNPFSDINTGVPPAVCHRCHTAESQQIPSYREHFNKSKTVKPGIQFVDIRNSNLCNAKCRMCGPHNSSQWAHELGHDKSVTKTNILPYKSLIVSDSLQSIYYTGGEPFINAEHWVLLEELVATGRSKNISLRYNSNLGTLKYKDKNIVDIWKNFKSVVVMASIDAVGEKFNYLRSGLDFDTVDQNLKFLNRIPTVKTIVTPTVSILNIWFLAELLEYYQGVSTVTLTDLDYPDFLSLSVIPDELQTLALEHLDKIESIYKNANKINFYRQQVQNNHNQHLFRETLNHVLLLDNIRKENLFKFLPFKQAAQQLVFYQ